MPVSRFTIGLTTSAMNACRYIEATEVCRVHTIAPVPRAPTLAPACTGVSESGLASMSDEGARQAKAPRLTVLLHVWGIGRLGLLFLWRGWGLSFCGCMFGVTIQVAARPTHPGDQLGGWVGENVRFWSTHPPRRSTGWVGQYFPPHETRGGSARSDI